MQVSGQNIIQSSDAMFSIMNQAQQEVNNTAEEIAVMSISEKTNAASDGIVGQVIDMFA